MFLINSLPASSHRRWWARWLLALMLLATLAPTVSRALAASHDPAGWMELCTSTGTRWVQVGEDKGHDQAPAPGGQVLDACGYCVLASERFAPMLPDLPAVLAHAPVWVAPAFLAPALPDPDAPRHAARDPPL